MGNSKYSEMKPILSSHDSQINTWCPAQPFENLYTRRDLEDIKNWRAKNYKRCTVNSGACDLDPKSVSWKESNAACGNVGGRDVACVGYFSERVLKLGGVHLQIQL